MTTRNVLLGVVLLSIGLVLGWAGRGCGSSMSGSGGNHSIGGHDGASTAEAHAVAWTCSMHPQIRLPEPVPCPICGMDLIPVDMSDGGSDPGSITLSPTARKLASVRTSTSAIEPGSSARRSGGTGASRACTMTSRTTEGAATIATVPSSCSASPRTTSMAVAPA